MKRLVIYYLINCLVLSQASVLIAQTISGQILDHHTEEPIPFANIYFNNSYTGTTSDIDGHFELDVSKNIGQIVIISSVGYYSNSLKEYSSNYLYKIYLKEKITLLSEVVVSGYSDLSRDEKLKMFKKEFLGKSSNGKSCIIENEDDLRLIYSESQKTLKAVSNKPLIIRNNALGYQIVYHLEEFSMVKKDVKYRGFAQFQEVNLPKNKAKIIRKNREEAYMGSRMEFFRSLWKNELAKSKTQVFTRSSYTEINLYDSVLSKNSELKYLQCSKSVLIKNRYFNSVLLFDNNVETLFTKQGYFDPDGISWSGKMAEKRVGDLLPYEYYPSN